MDINNGICLQFGKCSISAGENVYHAITYPIAFSGLTKPWFLPNSTIHIIIHARNTTGIEIKCYERSYGGSTSTEWCLWYVIGRI